MQISATSLTALFRQRCEMPILPDLCARSLDIQVNRDAD